MDTNVRQLVPTCHSLMHTMRQGHRTNSQIDCSDAPTTFEYGFDTLVVSPCFQSTFPLQVKEFKLTQMTMCNKGPQSSMHTPHSLDVCIPESYAVKMPYYNSFVNAAVKRAYEEVG